MKKVHAQQMDRAMSEEVLAEFFRALVVWKRENGAYLRDFGIRWDRSIPSNRLNFFELRLGLARQDAKRLISKNFNEFTEAEQVHMARQEMSVVILESI